MDRKELEDKTGLDARTIRFLIAENIVPAPNGSGRGASYDSSHLEAILEYKQLRQSGITSLDAIRDRFLKRKHVERVLEITKGLELHFETGAVSYQKFMLDPQVLNALEILKNAAERKM